MNAALEAILNKLDKIEAEGQLPPWKQPWKSKAMLPFNPKTEKTYQGINMMILLLESICEGYDDSRWIGYKQAQEQGWQVRKGETSTVIYLPILKTAKTFEVEDEEEDMKRVIGLKPVRVFNGSQIEGIPQMEIPDVPMFDRDPVVTEIADGMGVKIVESAQSAFYKPYTDQIHLPAIGAFKSTGGYHATVLHELGHATGHKSRLNRFEMADIKRAEEEVIAEIAAWLTGVTLGVMVDPDEIAEEEEQAAIYVAGWSARTSQSRETLISLALQSSRYMVSCYEQVQGRFITEGRISGITNTATPLLEDPQEDIDVRTPMSVSMGI